LEEENEGMKDLVDETGRFGEEKDMEFSMGKTRSVKFAGEMEMIGLMLRGQEIEKAEVYEYLGVKMGVWEDYLQSHEDKVRSRTKKLAGMVKAAGKGILCRPEMMRMMWKGAAVPAITYGQEVLCMNKDLRGEMDKAQREVGLRALGGTQLTAQEGLEGEWGCSNFEVREARAKLGFEGRLRFMGTDRWAKKVYMYVGVQCRNTRWEKKVRKIGEWKGIENRTPGGTVEQWVSRERKEAEQRGLGDRIGKAQGKSSLKYYREGEFGGWSGIYDGTFGSDLLFRARVGALETRRRMRWLGGTTECGICGEGVEDLEHVMLKCEGLKEERQRLQWENMVEEEEVNIVRHRLGLGREDEKDRKWREDAMTYLKIWKKLGGGVT